MLKTFLLLTLAMSLPASVLAQENRCDAKLADLPHSTELRGFNLGMSTGQVKQRLPQVVFGRADEFGVIKTSINPHYDPKIDKTGLDDVRTISLEFLDGQLTSLWIGFESSFKWSNVDDFVKGISRSLELPLAWSNWRDRGQQLHCVDFTFTVTMVARGVSFRIVDESAANLVAMRREAKEELASSQEAVEAGQIVSDKLSKTYYPSGCQPDPAIDESNRVVFRSIEAAEKAGYTRAKGCD